ncbi:hypothetical protein DM02DRAFT_654034 [Periconia macrospinosa]|uniref:Uncharacterized protein n=1 Tax=Periconia macrospinosa TaxID=97972 RepID=A0A2V1DUW8_9PLEO|nr:hypothetical protein DM02DRAFT_654034 [Periconia macrospinosa]
MSNENPLPIPTFVTSSPPSGPPGQSFEQSGQKPRYTKAEKRAYARQQKAAAGAPSQHKQSSRASRPANPKTHLGDYFNFTLQQIDDQIKLLSELRRLKAKASLETRVTRDTPQVKKEKKELSPQKLEKIQKRRELRAARKEAWLAKKAAEGGAVPAAAEQVAPVTEGPAVPVVKKTTVEDDEINWDEL